MVKIVPKIWIEKEKKVVFPVFSIFYSVHIDTYWHRDTYWHIDGYWLIYTGIFNRYWLMYMGIGELKFILAFIVAYLYWHI